MMDAIAALYDHDAERSIIGGVMLGGAADAAKVCSELPLAAVHGSASRAVYRAILALHTAKDQIDEVTVASELRRAGDLDAAGGAAAVVDLTSNIPTNANLMHYDGIVKGY